jgi:hypothetical protein
MKTGRSPRGPLSTTDTVHSPHRCATADRCDWQAVFDGSRLSTASRRQEDIPSDWRSTWAPTSMRGWSGTTSISLGQRACPQEAAHFPCPKVPLGRCREVRPTRSSVGIPRASERSSQPGLSSARELAVGPASTPSRLCFSFIRDLKQGLPSPPSFLLDELAENTRDDWSASTTTAPAVRVRVVWMPGCQCRWPRPKRLWPLCADLLVGLQVSTPPWPALTE